MPKRWQRRPDESNRGKFGPQDELGRLGLLAPRKVRQGQVETREGIVFRLRPPGAAGSPATPMATV
jgi:hypothetical protein